MKYYVRTGDGPPQPQTALEVYQQIRTGKITRETLACEVGGTRWTPAGELLPRLFEPNAEPPDEGAAAAAAELMGKAGHFIAEHSGEVAGLARLFARRILVSNFTVENASPEERKQLEAAPIPVRSPMAQNYAAWRRAMLWFAGIGLAFAAAVQLIDSFKQIFGSYVPFVIRGMNLGLVALSAIASGLIILAAVRWAQISQSRRLARWGWVLGFFGPLLLFLLPLQQLASDREWIVFLQSQQSAELAEQTLKASDAEITQYMTSQEGRMILLTLAFGFAVLALFLLVPRVFGLFPGIIRACMTLRTLVPESPLPGYIAAVITPLYCILLLVIMGMASQAGSGPLFFGLLALLCSPLMLIKEIRLLAKPMPPEVMNQHLRPLRLRMGVATGIGVVFILAMLGEHWDKFDLEWHSVASVGGQLLGNIFVLTVVSADFLLALMRFSFDQDKAVAGTALYTTMEQRYADLSQVKFTQLVDDAPAPPPPPPTSAPPIPS